MPGRCRERETVTAEEEARDKGGGPRGSVGGEQRNRSHGDEGQLEGERKTRRGISGGRPRVGEGGSWVDGGGGWR